MCAEQQFSKWRAARAKRRGVCGLLLGLALLFSGVSARAEESGGAVRVGLFPFDGFYVVEADGVRTGYGYDLLQMMAQHANFAYAYIDDVPAWSEMEQMLADGRLDLLTCVQKTPQNEARFAFSDVPVGTSYTLMTVRAGDSSIVPGQYVSYDGIRVGVIRDNSHAEKFAAFAREQNFQYTQVQYDTLEQLKDALQRGEVDAAVTSSLRLLRGEWVVEQFSPSPYYLMMRAGDSGLIGRIDQALRQLDVSAPNWRTELYNRYYTPDGGENLQLSAEERSYLAAHAGTVLRAAVCPDNAPYSYFEDGQAQGIIPEIFAEIARRAGIGYEVVNCPTHDAYRDLLRSGGADIVMDAGWDYSTAENMGYKLTSSYISLSLAQVSRIGYTGEIQTVAVPAGAIPDRLARTSLAEKYTFCTYPSIAKTMRAVSAGECDAAFLYNGDAQEYLAHNLRSKLRVSVLPQVQVDISVGSAVQNDYLLLSVLSKSAESVEKSYVSETVLRHMTNRVTAPISLQDYLYLNPAWGIALAVSAALLLAALAVILYQRVWHRRLRAAKREAEAANEAKSTFLSSMSHDLRTPLGGVLGFADLAVREPDVQKKQEYLLKIRASGELLLSLVNDTLELSRIESGKMTLENEAAVGREIIDSVVTAVRPSAQQKGIELLADIRVIEGETVWADRSKIQKILLNLLSNAVKYTPPGGSITLRAAVLDPPENGCNRRITIRDNGIGMSDAFLTKLYEPFMQEHRPEAKGTGGTGLGLSIVKRTVDFLGGRIAVESAVGRGTCFTVDLPIAMAPETEVKRETPQLAPALLQGRRVLLCEDNAVNTEIAVLLLRGLGLAVDCAADGQKGLEHFCAGAPGTYTAILMDIRMVMNGYEAAQAIRALPRPDAADIPIIAMTADAFEDDVQKCFAAGMNGHIAKPIDAQVLRGALERAVR